MEKTSFSFQLILALIANLNKLMSRNAWMKWENARLLIDEKQI